MANYIYPLVSPLFYISGIFLPTNGILIDHITELVVQY